MHYCVRIEAVVRADTGGRAFINFRTRIMDDNESSVIYVRTIIGRRKIENLQSWVLVGLLGGHWNFFF